MPMLERLFRPLASRRSDQIDWTPLRAPVVDEDRALLSATHLWLRRIPTPMHPKQLCRYYPRVANRLAQNWDDPGLTDKLFDDLLTDRRGKRKGFPERIKTEIERLERYHGRRPRFERLRPLAKRIRDWAKGSTSDAA